LIRRVADENRLWRAPRIHGELPKLGIVVSERTVSRYLHGRPRTPSQTWRTFLANHLGQIAYISEFPSLNESGDGVVDALAEAWRATASPHCDVRRRNARWSMCPRRFDAQMSAAISPRITFATARACRGAAGRSPPPDARAVPYSTHHRAPHDPTNIATSRIAQEFRIRHGHRRLNLRVEAPPGFEPGVEVLQTDKTKKPKP